MVLKISHRLRQRPAMPCYSVVWNRVRYQVMTKLIGLTGLEGPMPKNICQIIPSPLLHLTMRKRMGLKPVEPCPVSFNQGTCSYSATHETKGVLYKHVCSFCFTSANKFSHTLNLNVEIKRKLLQKTRKPGHESFWYPCP